MEALFYLFPFPLLLLLLVVVTLVILVVVPKRILPKKKWGLRLLGIEILFLIFYSWHSVQPKEYPRTYQQNNIDSTRYLSMAAENRELFIGVAVSNQTKNRENIGNYFNSVTPENELKWGRLIGDDLRTYDFSEADAIINFALERDFRIRGHVLVWGRAVDFFKSPDLRVLLKDLPQEAMPDTLQQLIKTNIETVLERYRGKISQWDVVNEPLNVFDGGFDQNIFYEYLGKEYIANSFRWAHEVDSEAELYLNEQFDRYDSDKAVAFLELVRELVADDVPIHGVGIQAHAMFTIPKMKPFKSFLQEISDMGLKIEITEMDARLRLFDGFDDPYQAQGDFYQEFCAVCLQTPACTGITVWGISDGFDWYDNMGIFRLHMPNQSTLFDADMNAKPAYFGLLHSLQGG